VKQEGTSFTGGRLPTPMDSDEPLPDFKSPDGVACPGFSILLFELNYSRCGLEGIYEFQDFDRKNGDL